MYALIATPQPIYITALMGIYCVGMGLVFANTATRALDIFPNLKGAASAMMGGFESLVPVVTVSVVSNFFNETILPVVLVQLTCSVICILIISALVVKEYSLIAKPQSFYRTALMGIYCVGMVLVFANTATRAIDIFPNLKGAASGMIGGFESLVPVVTVSVVSNFFNETILPVVLVQLTCSVICILIISALVVKESSL